MKNKLVVADSSPIFSLAVIDRLDLLTKIFEDVKIPRAVWLEITQNNSTFFYQHIFDFFENKVYNIIGQNEFVNEMDFGESESVILYHQLNADFLLIDDKKARLIAEKLNINCIGTIGLLSVAKDKGFVNELRPLFETFLLNKRYYSLSLLNHVLMLHNENIFDL